MNPSAHRFEPIFDSGPDSKVTRREELRQLDLDRLTTIRQLLTRNCVLVPNTLADAGVAHHKPAYGPGIWVYGRQMTQDERQAVINEASAIRARLRL